MDKSQMHYARWRKIDNKKYKVWFFLFKKLENAS